MKNICKAVSSRLENLGFISSIVPFDKLKDVNQKIVEQYKNNDIDPYVYKKEFKRFINEDHNILGEARSIIIAAYMSPVTKIEFIYNGKTYKSEIPPQYVHKKDKFLEDVLKELVIEHGYNIIKSKLPEKAVAVHSGLVKYGRNNITYNDKWGSYLRFQSYLSDLPAEEIDWHPFEYMEKCTNCNACINKCPTGAICKDRFLLKAEKCLTFLNEYEGDFPAWVDPSVHHAIVGCKICQDVCPMNKAQRDNYEEGPIFNENETLEILNRVPENKLSKDLADKLTDYDLMQYKPFLHRNLTVVINAIEMKSNKPF